MYSENGAVPLSLAVDAASSDAFSVYYFTTDPTVTAALFVVQALFAVQLILGYRTRFATVVSFLLVISLDHRNPLVLSYADTLFRLLLFWAIFLPLGERWSVDAVHRSRETRRSYVGAAGALALGQMVTMYFINGLHKSTDEYWTTGDAAPLVMGLGDTTFLLGDFVSQFTTVMQAGGLAWYYMMLASWLLIVLVGRKRYLAVGVYAFGHAAFAVTVRIGAFPYVAMAGLVLFLQTRFWEDLGAVGRRLGVEPERLAARLSRLERAAAVFPNPRQVDERTRRLRSRAYTVSIVVVVAAILIASAFSAQPVDERSPVEPDEHIEDVADRFSIDQPSWSVFAPTPRTTDRYYVFAAETADGEYLDVYNDRELSYDRPYEDEGLQSQYGTYRERFYMNDVRRAGFDDRHDAPEKLGDYLCESWREERGVELVRINMHYISEDVTMDTITEPEERDRSSVELYQHACGDNVEFEIQPPDF